MNERADRVQAEDSGWLRKLGALASALLRMYAGCFFSASPWVGGLLLCATMLSPVTGLMGLLGVSSAVLTARATGLVSEATPATVFAYNALFMGLGASHTFASPYAALALVTLGGAASALLTAGVRGLLAHVGLPSLSLPFLLIYVCAISAGRALGAEWAVMVPAPVPSYLLFVPAFARMFFEALGAIVFDPRMEVGMLVFAAICAVRVHAALLALLALAITMLCDLGLTFTPALRFAALLNAVFAALGLGMGWWTPSPTSYLRAAAGALLCVVLTLGLAQPLGRLDLVPLSLPFNLSIYAVFLVARQHALLTLPGSTIQQFTTVREPGQTDATAN